ncbi:DUF4185 domain-containing protein [Nocardioides sp. YIM 152315]|uniref:DUF4185 domain-containing protein n=1 Tax=Nocardioides sp. YIM 152315 TaxID=3031760 RepID=UPI0023D9EFFE|nr:DUF4185 domain-containing protein [Nocardioides sp. YIM 152315]MDF1603247.1 DUF4185 domain-containing protein [Nocardioides sp. YIM 152315]
MTAQATPTRTLSGVSDVTEVSRLTGPDSPNHTDAYEIAGTDLGSMFEAGGKTWFVFGDTFGQREPGLTGGGGTEWRSNALAWTTDEDPTDGITLEGFVLDEAGRAAELIPSQKVDHVEMTAIPTYGFEANGAMYLQFMSVNHWGDPGVWDANHAGLAKSTDAGRTWTVLDEPRWPGETNFVQVSVAEIDDELFFWSVPAGRFGGVQLMKVPTRDVEDLDAYRYFVGTDDDEPRWSERMEDAATIVDDTVGELSVVWNDYLDSWLMSYSDGADAGTALRQAPTPWGPWGDPVTLLSQSDVPGLYAPYLKQGYTADHGRTIYFSLSKWDPYNVYWYRADLVAK